MPPTTEAVTAGSLLATQTILNEFVAYLDWVALPPANLSERSRLLITIALCGFVNLDLGSLGIMISDRGTIVPRQQQEIVSLGMKFIIASTLASCMTGTVIDMS